MNAIYDPDFTLPPGIIEASKRITFDEQGNAQFIYDEEMVAMLKGIGPMETTRASHVEPYGDGWTADMSPVGGGLYGPFETRKFALAFEVEWLRQNRGL